MPHHDNDSAIPGSAPFPLEVHGQAALLLVESLIHGLRENDVLTAGDAAAIAQRAVDVQFDHAQAADGAGAPLWRSHALLSSIAASLSIDAQGEPLAPRPA